MADGLHDFWNSLRRAEQRFEAEAKETERELYRTVYGYKSRVMRMRSALAKSGPIALQTVTRKLEGISLDAVWDILFSAVRDMALYYGGSVVLGTAVGAGLGSLAFGVGAIPGAAIGAEAGNVVGEWVLIYLGLKMLAEGLVNTIPPALRLYVQAFRLAWGPVESDRPDARYSADYHHGEDMAAHRFADGHVLMIMAILMAIVAYLTRGKSEEALMQAVRKSERIGTKMADWLADNKERLLKEESLKPKVAERAPSQETKPDELTKRRSVGGSRKAADVSDAETADNSAKVARTRYPVATKPNEAFFWSGRTNGIGGAEAAGQIAQAKGGTTLEMLIENRNIDMPAWDATDPNVVQAWKDISADYASGASGTVRAVIGENLRPGNVWETSELPALMNNPNVNQIITIDPATGAEKVIFVRGQ